MQGNIPPQAGTGGTGMTDAALNRRMTVRLAEAVAFAQVGVLGFDGTIDLRALDSTRPVRRPMQRAAPQ